jgi:RimJ/RimL family protein N-acetyltransferase
MTLAEFPNPDTISLRGHGIELREWTDADLPVMVELFDEPEFDRRTPLASPFNLEAATAYLENSRKARAAGTRIQLAITRDGGAALGEVLLFPSGPEGQDTELAYGVGAAFRRRGLASAAVRLTTEFVLRELAPARVILRIDPDNAASVGTAERCGFRRSADPLAMVESKNRRTDLGTWEYVG